MPGHRMDLTSRRFLRDKILGFCHPMWTIAVFVSMLFVFSSSYGQVNLTGNLTDYIDNIVDQIPGTTPANLYQVPNSSETSIWRQIIQDIMTGDYANANNQAASLEYRVVHYTDNSVNPNHEYYVLERVSGATSHYWGTFVFNTNPLRYRLVIQSPHPENDRNTGYQGFRVFKEAGARAFFVSGIHRCNNTTDSPCDGTTTTCTGSAAPYRVSDPPHNVTGTFQITTEEMLAYIPDLFIIQPHGFSKGTGDPDVIASNGSRYTPAGTDYLVELCNNYYAQDNSLTFKIAHIDLDWDELIARTNVQGRLLNQVVDPCGTYATMASGRFFHLEQAYDKLRDSEANWYKLVNAVILTFPEDNGMISRQSGSWTDPETWLSGTVPGPNDNVSILEGHVITVDNDQAECHSIVFGGPNAHIDMNANSRLTVYGDFMLYSQTHNVFSAGWSAENAVVRFAGDEDQLLSGWSTSGGSTSFRDVIIEKGPDAIVRTDGSGMRLGIQNSLDIISGILSIEPDDDIEARWASSGNLTSNQDLNVTVEANGRLRLIDGDGTHFIRSGAGSLPIGRMTIYGNVELYDASSYDISIDGIDIKDGGTLEVGTGLGSTTYGPEFNPGLINIESGGSLYNVTTSDVWFDTTVVDLQPGGTYKTSSSSTIFPPTLYNNAKVRYQRDPVTVATDQVVVDTGYIDIEFSFNGNATKKIWSLTNDRAIVDSLIVNNDAEFILEASSPHTLTVGGTIRLTSGVLDNDNGSAVLALADGGVISRAYGEISTAPQFLGSASVRYSSNTTPVLTGPELPTDENVLYDLIIDSDVGVTLGSNVTVNHALQINDGPFMTSGFTATLGANATIDESSGYIARGRVQTTIILTQSTNEDFGGLGVEINAVGAAPGQTSVVRTTGAAQSLPGGASVSRCFDIVPQNNSGLNATIVFHYDESELNDNEETHLQLYSSDDGGANWTPRGGTIDTDANTVTLSGVDSFSVWTLGSEVSYICGDANNDGHVNLLDILFLISNIYEEGPDPLHFEAADVDSSGNLNLLDILKLIDNLYGAGNPLNCQ